MNEDSNIQLTFCKKHNLYEEYLNPNKSNQAQRLLCRLCIDEFFQIVPIQKLRDENQYIIDQFDSQFKSNTYILQIIMHSLLTYQETLNKQAKNIEGIIKVIRNKVISIEDEVKKARNQFLQREDIRQQHYKYVEGQRLFQKNIIQQIETLKQSNWIDDMIQTIRKMDLKNLNYGDVQDEKVQNQLVVQQVPEQREQQNNQLETILSIQQKNGCFAFAFNKDNSTIAAGDWSKIKLFEFKNQQLKELQLLDDKGHQSQITTLQFFQKSDSLISGSLDKTIKIWKQNSNKQWIHSQTLTEHTHWVSCLVINSNEDLIISGSRDNFIIFWELQDSSWSIHKKIKSESIVWSLSLNESCNKLISSQDNYKICVIVKQGTQWSIIQRIRVEQFGYRLCFISDNEFVFLPEKSQELELYQYNLINREFQRINKIQINNSDEEQDGFPIKFVKSKNLLIVKSCNSVNVLREQQGNNNFTTDALIKFDSSYIYGGVSNDGQFLITYDKKSEQIQIRRLKE